MKALALIVSALLLIGSQGFGESLWHSEKNNEVAMFSDRKATQLGDILTVVVSESTSMNKNVSKNSSSSAQLNYGISSLFFPGSGLGKHNGSLPSATMNPTTDTFTGSGNVSDSSSVSASLTVLVVDTLPNGNLVIEGAKQIDMGGEIQYAIVRGIIRKDDVTAANTVDSTRVASAQVQFMSKGDLAKARKKGWISKFWDTVNIF